MVENAQNRRSQTSVDLKQLTVQRTSSFTLPEKSRNMFTISALRSIVLGFVSVLLLVGLFSSVRTKNMPHSSLEVLNGIKSATTWTPRDHHIKKVTAVLGERNEIYESALKTHERHNSLHGYESDVLRERIIGSYWSKPAYLLAQVVNELAKPIDKRNDWIMWVDPDTIILNPQIPLETFLPPADYDEVNLVATHDRDGFNGGAYFIRVCEWSIKLLIEVLAIPRMDPKADLGIEKSQTAMGIAIAREGFRDQVVFQPRGWYNARHGRDDKFEGREGDLMVHFQGLDGDKWLAMAGYLDTVTAWNSPWEVKLKDTTYADQVEEFWARIRLADKLLRMAKGKDDPEVKKAGDRLLDAVRFRTDQEGAFNDAIDHIKRTLHLPDSAKIT